MHSVQVQSLVLGLAAATASAGTLSVPVQRGPLHPGLTITKRDGTVDFEAVNNVSLGGYFAEFEIGTPPQTIAFQLDTGSSDTWVNTPSTDLCESDLLQALNGYCMATYDPEASSTYEYLSMDFDIAYLDGREISGLYFNETVTIGEAVLEDQQLGLALQSVRPTGLMGLGFANGVAAEESYPTIVDHLFRQGYINARVFSMYLNELGSDSGTVLFGGIDSEKYIQDLAFLPLVSDFQSRDDQIRSWNVPIEQITYRNADGDVVAQTDRDLNATALVDSGSTVCILPNDFANELYERFDVRTLDVLPLSMVACDWRGERGQGHEIDFVFDGKTIRIPISEMIIDSFASMPGVFDLDDDLSQLRDDFNGRVCMFGVDAISSVGIRDESVMILGDTFMRSAYIVYDMENLEIGLAQANINNDESNVVEVNSATSNSTTVPRVSGPDGQTGDDRRTYDDAAGHVLPSMALGGIIVIAAGFLAS